MREEFPILHEIVYLDSAATTQKPTSVIKSIEKAYKRSANVHRSAHRLARENTASFEDARNTVASFIGCNREEVVFTSGTTHGINLIAQTIPLTPKSIIICSELEHHANFVIWQQRAKQVGCTIKYIRVKNNGLDYEHAKELISQGCSVLAITHLSNVTGAVTDVMLLSSLVKKQGGLVIVDGAQAVAHLPVNVHDLGIDAYAFGAHKLYGPTGIGALFIRSSLAKTLPPFLYGGEMIEHVSVTETTFAQPPSRFEAGTPAIVQSIGFKAAIDWFTKNYSHSREQEIYAYAKKILSTLPKIRIFTHPTSIACLSFIIEGVHVDDICAFLDSQNIAIRSGHHCTQPLHTSLGIPSSLRVSLGIYSTKEDIDACFLALQEAIQVLS